MVANSGACAIVHSDGDLPAQRLNLEAAKAWADGKFVGINFTKAQAFSCRATADTWIETTAGNKLLIPKGTHILLDVWHANRHEDHWGVSVTGYSALDFVPERWERLTSHDRGLKDLLHFGFGHGPRFCPGKHLGQLEVALVVGAFVKLFRFKAVNPENQAKAGVSTKPLDGVLVELELRRHAPAEPGAAADRGVNHGMAG